MTLFIALSFASIAVSLMLIRRRRRRARQSETQETHRQYSYLYRGGFLSEAAVHQKRTAMESWLARGEVTRVEEEFQSRRRFAICSRALAEIGTEQAREILERQLEPRLGIDPIEQDWLRLDVAGNLRQMNRLFSLPPLIRIGAGPESPLIHLLAAEVVSFPCFSGFLYQLDSPLGRSALRVLLRAVVGLRHGVDPRIIVAGRIGDAIEIIWKQRFELVDPLMVRLFAEARRLWNRTEHLERWLVDDDRDLTAFREQLARIEALAPGIDDYLDEAPGQLLRLLASSPLIDQSDILHACIEVKANPSAIVIELMNANRTEDRASAFGALRHCTNPATGQWIVRWIVDQMPKDARDIDGRSIEAALRVLRFHASAEAEQTLIGAARHSNRRVRMAAIESLGWWAPIDSSVFGLLKKATRNREAGVQEAATAALARLGERNALNLLRSRLGGVAGTSIHQTIQHIADQGIVLLWPELDALTDADDREIAQHAGDAVAQLREETLECAGFAK